LDKSTRDHLSALDAFIKAEAEQAKPQQEGEFTITEYRKKMAILGMPVSDSIARRKMKSLIESGVLTSRKSTATGYPVYYKFL
jgi:hypothetical protein